jgi:hypothetical protein
VKNVASYGDDDDMLMLSSEDESVECTNTSMVAVKTEPVEPVSTQWLTSSVCFNFLILYFTDYSYQTAITAMLKAPPAKQLKTETSATTRTDARVPLLHLPKPSRVLLTGRNISPRVARWKISG